MKENTYRKEFLKIFEKFAYRYSNWEVWNDFLYLAATSLSNVFKTKDYEQREQRYLSIIKKYTKEYQELFPELLGILTLALEENPNQDFLGSVYHELKLHQEQKGQFFTPYNIAKMMARIIASDRLLNEDLLSKGYISVNDPACGSGVMMIALANLAKEQKINYQNKILLVAQDIDMTAALMCYIQLSLLGCSAIIIIGDTLTKPGFHPDNQIWCTPFYYLNEWRFRNFFHNEKEVVVQKADVIIDSEQIQEYLEEGSGQLMFELVS